jgi:cytidylate kinase
MKNSFAVAIDGPAGSGKSSVARALSERFNFIHFDSGACYRAVAFYFLSKGIKDIQRIEQADLSSLIQLEYLKGSLYLNGKKLGEEIRTPDVSRFTSDISTKKTVRDFVTASIRDMIRGHNVIMEGRDIGSVVLPDADLKVYLTATPRERAKRRLKEWQENGEQIELKEVIKEIERRDQQESNRSLAPLKPAENAILLDTTSLSFHEVVEEISSLILKKKGDSGYYKEG